MTDYLCARRKTKNAILSSVNSPNNPK